MTCSVCGRTLTSPITRSQSFKPTKPLFCDAHKADYHRWVRANCPEYNERVNELRRRRRAKLKASEPVQKPDVWKKPCRGCGMLFDMRTLTNGLCGAPWCEPVLTPGALRDARLALKLTHTQAAARVKVSANTWDQWERGNVTPHMLRVPQLIRFIRRAERMSQ